MPWSVAVLSHQGLVRPSNEDNVAIDHQIIQPEGSSVIAQVLCASSHCLMIADGMGGHANGALASRTALEFLADRSPDRWLNLADYTLALNAANDCIYDLMATDLSYAGMGTTIVGAVLSDKQLIVFNVGDSRCYLHAPGELIQLSVNDVPPVTIGASLAQRSHVITQSLGGRLHRKFIRPNVGLMPPLALGETLLLCSDGLTDMVDEAEIENVLVENIDLKAKVCVLERLAMAGGGKDNISLVVAQLV